MAKKWKKRNGTEWDGTDNKTERDGNRAFFTPIIHVHVHVYVFTAPRLGILYIYVYSNIDVEFTFELSHFLLYMSTPLHISLFSLVPRLHLPNDMKSQSL